MKVRKAAVAFFFKCALARSQFEIKRAQRIRAFRRGHSDSAETNVYTRSDSFKIEEYHPSALDAGYCMSGKKEYFF